MTRIVVTGANKGIGLAIVTAILAENTHAEVFLGSRNAARGEAARAGLLAAHPHWADRLHLLELDVSDDASVAAAAAAVRAQGAPLTGLVNNAGIGSGSLQEVFDVNVRGIHRVCAHFLPLVGDGGRVVNVTSASGPLFVARCSAARQAAFLDASLGLPDLEALLATCESFADSVQAERAGLEPAYGVGGAYGFSKACANTLTLHLAAAHPRLRINACTPGFIETDMTRPFAASRGVSPAELGMKQPRDGARSTLHLLFSPGVATGQYFGSDGVRSPLHAYRSPGDPPYTGQP